jgi:tripartite-type tricarboxylate transporter receptor subunit TctC
MIASAGEVGLTRELNDSTNQKRRWIAMTKLPFARIRVLARFMFLALPLVFMGPGSAMSQAKYPTGPIDMIVTFAPGGAADGAARSLAPYLSKYLGVPVVVKNVPPPRTGEDIFSRSKPDGYTIGSLAGAAVASDETFFKVRFRGREFVWIATNAATPGVIFSNAKGPIQKFDDLAKVGAGRPIKIGAFSIYSSTTVATIIALEEKKIPYTFVTGFKGAAPAMTSLLRGEVDIVGTTLGSGSAFYKSGDAKPILLIQSDPDPQLPDAPTLGQVGLSASSGYLGAVVFALVAPPGTSSEIRDVLASAHKKAIDDPMYQAQLEKVGFTLSYVPPEKVQQWVNNIYDAFEKVKPTVEAHVK